MGLELTDCYAISLCAGLILIWLAGSAGRSIRFVFIPLRPVLLWGISRGEAALLGGLAAANGLCIGIAVNKPEDVINRLTQIILINLIPIFFGAHMNPLASLCGIRYEHHRKLHTWLGVLVVIEVTICIGLTAKYEDAPGRGIPGLLASSCLGGIALSPALQPRLFELFSWLHSLLAAALVVALWLYLPPSALWDRPRLYLLLCCSTFVAAKVLRLVNIVYRSLSFKGKSIVRVQDIGDVVEMRVWPARPLNFQAGQYIYLSLRGVSWLPPLSALELHPFQITWSYRDNEGKQVLVLLSQTRRGITKRLSKAKPKARQAFMEGPYGRSLAVGGYGTVLLIATGIGIAGQLPYIKELLVLYRRCEAKVRRIVLLWELDAEAHRWWVRDWMDELLENDTDHILELQLFIRGKYVDDKVSEGTVRKLGSHDRIELHYKALSPAWMIRSELVRRKGKTLVLLCADSTTTQTITREIGEHLWGSDIHMEKLDFAPGDQLKEYRRFRV